KTDHDSCSRTYPMIPRSRDRAYALDDSINRATNGRVLIEACCLIQCLAGMMRKISQRVCPESSLTSGHHGHSNGIFTQHSPPLDRLTSLDEEKVMNHRARRAGFT